VQQKKEHRPRQVHRQGLYLYKHTINQAKQQQTLESDSAVAQPIYTKMDQQEPDQVPVYSLLDRSDTINHDVHCMQGLMKQAAAQAAATASTSLLLLCLEHAAALHVGVILLGRPCTVCTTQPTCRAEQQACSTPCRTGRPSRKRCLPGLQQRQPRLQQNGQRSSSASPAPKRRYAC
jgi:hypothetical protein